MTLDQRIETLLKTDIGCSECGDVAADELRTNLKQAFERGQIAFVPSILEIAQALRERKQGHPNDMPIEMLELSQAEAILSLLTKGKDNASIGGV